MVIHPFQRRLVARHKVGPPVRRVVSGGLNLCRVIPEFSLRAAVVERNDAARHIPAPSIAETGGSPLTLRNVFLFFLVFLIAATIVATLGMLDRDACLDAGGRWIIERGACEVPEGTTFVTVSRRVVVWLTWTVVLAVVAFSIALARDRRRAMKDRNAPARDVYVYIDDDGSARELTPDEEEYLSTEFQFGDGAAPYIKGYYRQRAPFGRLAGFLARRDLPRRIIVRPAPPREP